MTDFLKPDVLGLFLLLVVPGFVAIKVYDLRVPSERRNLSQSLIEIISISMLNLAVWFWRLLEITEAGFRERHPGWFYAAIYFVFFISPAGLALLFHKALTSRWLRSAVTDPTATAWDHFFRKRKACWMIFHLKSGKIMGGFFGGDSAASSFPRPQEVYVEEVWRVDAEFRFVERVERTAGAIISREECSLVEIFWTTGDRDAEA